LLVKDPLLESLEEVGPRCRLWAGTLSRTVVAEVQAQRQRRHVRRSLVLK